MLFYLCILLVSASWALSEYKSDAFHLHSGWMKNSNLIHTCGNEKTSLHAVHTSIRGGAKKVVSIANENSFNNALKNAGPGKLVVVDFTASWCPPCKSIAPVYQEMASSAEYSDVTFLKVDVDEASSIAARYSVSSMPTFVFIKNGKEVQRFSGASVQTLKAKVKALQR